MKMMTYNVHRGGKDRIPVIFKVIEDENPDILCIQEACSWREASYVKKLATLLNIPDTQILYAEGNLNRSSSGHIYDLAIFSKLPITKYEIEKDPEKIWHAMIAFDVAIPSIGQTRIINAHLSPKSVDWRKKEVAVIRELIKEYKKGPVVLLGDLNSLSPKDPYPENLFKQLEERGITKFGNPPEFEIIPQLTDMGFEDFFDFQITVWEESNDKDHLNLRLDYILTKNIPKEKIIKKYILNTNNARQASDHFPVVMRIG